MNVLQALIAVIFMQPAATLKEVTPALATLDTQAMGSPAQVCCKQLILPSQSTCLDVNGLSWTGTYHIRSTIIVFPLET